MEGRGGNDVYHIDQAGDLVLEFANDGFDIIYSGAYGYTLPANVESLRLSLGGGNGFGNDLQNEVFGNVGSNVLDGRGANDGIVGDLGSDTLIGGAGADDMYCNTWANRSDDKALDSAVNDSGRTQADCDEIFGFVTYGMGACRAGTTRCGCIGYAPKF